MNIGYSLVSFIPHKHPDLYNGIALAPP